MSAGQKSPAACVRLRTCLLFILLLAASLLIAGEHIRQQDDALRRELALIAAVERTHPAWTADYLNLVYTVEPASAETARLAREALQAYGYSADGVGILRERLFPLKGELAFYALLLTAFTLCAAGVFALHRAQKQQLEEKEKEIGRLKDAVSRQRYLEEKNEELKRFIENIAHQVKTPLSRMVLALEAEKVGTGQECLWHAEEIGKLVSRLLAIARMEAGEVAFTGEAFDLADLFADLALGFAEGERPVILPEPAGSPMPWQGSYVWLREAFCNLLENAREHDTSGLPAVIRCTRERDWYRITLRDHGPGIPEADIPHIFDRFYLPMHSKKGHVGLGLNLCKLIVEGHKGQIHAENHPQGGAVFTVMLPRHRWLK